MKLEFSRQISEKKLKSEVSSKYVLWEPICFMRTDGRTERQTGRHRDGRTDGNEASSRFP
jgi:hypothetical protein